MSDAHTHEPTRGTPEGPAGPRPAPGDAGVEVRRVFCNRTLNLGRIRAVGYDMDYTLLQYRVIPWEQRAYDHLKEKLLERAGWGAVAHLTFDPELVIRGLVVDLELGNLVKANRFGYIKIAAHGTRRLDHGEVRAAYGREIVDLADPRYAFVNTLFSLSELAMYAQLVDLYDAGGLPDDIQGYTQLYRIVRRSLDEAHMEGRLKAAIVRDPARFVEPDPEMPLALLDQRRAGKLLMLITNSEWEYTDAMMSHAFGGHLPAGQSWRDLFDLTVVEARKPAFFAHENPFYEVVSEDGLMRPVRGALRRGGIYVGGSAAGVEAFLGVAGDEILFVGDHLYSDVHVSKSILRWRTALVLHELDREVAAVASFRARQRELSELMARKEALEQALNRTRLRALRLDAGYGPTAPAGVTRETLAARGAELEAELEALDARIGPLARAAGELGNRRWGLLMRTGNDKSQLARQVERYADIYTARVSHLAWHTPFAYLRSHRGSLPHDPGQPGVGFPPAISTP